MSSYFEEHLRKAPSKRCRNHGQNFYCFVYFWLWCCAKVKHKWIKRLKRLLYEECIKYGFCFIENGVVLENESGKINYFIQHLNNFLRPLNHSVWGL